MRTQEKNKFVLFFPYLSTSERDFWNCRALSKQRWPKETGEGQGPEKERATEKAAGNIEHVVSPEYSCIHMCLTFLPSLSVSVFLALFFSCSLVLLFSCSRSQRRLSQLVVLTDFCGNACVSLSLDVCFAPVLVMLLLGCGKIINMGCRLEEGVGWSWCWVGGGDMWLINSGPLLVLMTVWQ